GDGQRRIGEAQQRHTDEHGGRDEHGERGERPHHTLAAKGAEHQREPQSENVCNHSRPSTSPAVPDSSTNRDSRVCPARTSSTVPSARTSPPMMIATLEPTRSMRSMPWLDRITVPPWATYARRMSRMTAEETGSIDSNGSSSTSTRGEWIIA